MAGIDRMSYFSMASGTTLAGSAPLATNCASAAIVIDSASTMKWRRRAARVSDIPSRRFQVRCSRHRSIVGSDREPPA